MTHINESYAAGYIKNLDKKERAEYGGRIAIRIWKNDKLAQADYEKEHRGGYCPKCHCLRTESGKCMNGCDD